MIITNLCQVAQGTAQFPTTEALQHKQIYFYSEDVTIATMVGAGYFEDVADESVGGNGTLNEGDIMFLFASDGIKLATVTDAVAGTVAVATAIVT